MKFTLKKIYFEKHTVNTLLYPLILLSVPQPFKHPGKHAVFAMHLEDISPFQVCYSNLIFM